MCSTGFPTGEVGSEVDSRSTSSSNSCPEGTVFEFKIAGINRRYSASNLRQLVVSILLYSSLFQIAIGGFAPCKYGR